jgi:uncharacterized membrane protein
VAKLSKTKENMSAEGELELNDKQLNSKVCPKSRKGSNTPQQQPTKYPQWRARAEEKINTRLEEESKEIIILKFFAAPIIVLIGIVFLFLILEFGVFTHVGGLMLAYFFPPLGKESVIPIGVAAGLNPILIGLAIAFVDIFVAIFLLWNYDFAKLMPALGPWMEKIEKKGGDKFQKHKWLENLAFVGLVLFVMFPFQGSGGVATSIIGRVIGMNKYKVFFAICIGAVVGCLLIAYFSDYFIGFFKNNIYQGLALLIAIAIILAIYNVFKYLKNKNQYNYIT